MESYSRAGEAPASLQRRWYSASTFVATIEKRQGLKICCPEEIAYRQGFIEEEAFGDPEYGTYLSGLLSSREALPESDMTW